MWIFTSKCFLSIVNDKDQPNSDKLLVRARVEGGIEELFPEAKTKHTPNHDYAYRAWIKRNEVSRVVQNYINALDYPNFKNSIKDDDYHHACNGVWQEMYQYQNQKFSRNLFKNIAIDEPYDYDDEDDSVSDYSPRFFSRGVVVR